MPERIGGVRRLTGHEPLRIKQRPRLKDAIRRVPLPLGKRAEVGVRPHQRPRCRARRTVHPHRLMQPAHGVELRDRVHSSQQGGHVVGDLRALAVRCLSVRPRNRRETRCRQRRHKLFSRPRLASRGQAFVQFRANLQPLLGLPDAVCTLEDLDLQRLAEIHFQPHVGRFGTDRVALAQRGVARRQTHLLARRDQDRLADLLANQEPPAHVRSTRLLRDTATDTSAATAPLRQDVRCISILRN